MSNEIKQGDKVRVSKDAPRVFSGNVGVLLDAPVWEVHQVVDGYAFIINGKLSSAIPTKFLIKVDAEAKEANVKIGDKVVVHCPSGDMIGRIQEVMLDGTYDIDYGGGCTGHNITRSQIEIYTTPKIKVGDRVKDLASHKIGTVLIIEGNSMIVGIPYDDWKYVWSIDAVELVDTYTEQTEAEEDARIRQMDAELDDFRKAELDRVLHPEKYYTYEVTIYNMAMNWPRYEADLAKEIALKVTNKKMDNLPKEIGEYAVSVAKAVVEGLKRK